MNRDNIYKLCERIIEKHNGYCISEVMLSKEAIDAIIDCAVQEAVKEMWHQLDDMARGGVLG